MVERKPAKTEYICKYCGKLTWRLYGGGRPHPDKCPARPIRGGMTQPHVWIKNRDY